MGEIITGRLQSALWTQFVLLSTLCCHKLQSDYHSGHQVVSLLCNKGSVKGNSTKEVFGLYILSLVHTRMGSMSFCTQFVFNQMSNPHHLWRLLSSWHVFHVPGNRRVCCPKWVMHQTLDSNMPVNYTISQSQPWAHKPSVLHNSERKEFAGWLRMLAERVAAGEDRGCCWSELICSCSLCAMVAACCLVPLGQIPPGHTKGWADSPLMHPCGLL